MRNILGWQHACQSRDPTCLSCGCPWWELPHRTTTFEQTCVLPTLGRLLRSCWAEDFLGCLVGQALWIAHSESCSSNSTVFLKLINEMQLIIFGFNLSQLGRGTLHGATLGGLAFWTEGAYLRSNRPAA